MSSLGWSGLSSGAVVGDAALVDLAGEQWLEAADDVAFVEAFGGAAAGAVDGGLVEAHAHDDGSAEGSVGVSVSASGEPVSVGDP